MTWLRKHAAPLIVFALFTVLGGLMVALKVIADQGRDLRRLGVQSVEQGARIERQGELLAAQDKRLTEILEGRTPLLNAILANQQGIQATADDAKAAAEAVPNCFVPPEGPCVKASLEFQQVMDRKLAELATKIETVFNRTEFIVRRIDENGGQQVFKATPVPSDKPSCDPAVEVGNIGVGDGVLCQKP